MGGPNQAQGAASQRKGRRRCCSRVEIGLRVGGPTTESNCFGTAVLEHGEDRFRRDEWAGSTASLVTTGVEHP